MLPMLVNDSGVNDELHKSVDEHRQMDMVSPMSHRRLPCSEERNDGYQRTGKALGRPLAFLPLGIHLRTLFLVTLPEYFYMLPK